MKESFTAKKRYGQNFLTSPDIPKRIAENCGADIESAVLEIGPGKGILTSELARVAKKVCAVEIDRELEPYLNEKLAAFNNVSITFADILELDLKAFSEESFGGLPIYVCANLPYYITTPIITKLLETKPAFKAITVMVQREVADRLCAKPGTAQYGAITAFVNYYADVKRLFTVPAGCFTPKPKVNSAVIKLTVPDKKAVIPSDEKLFFDIIRAAFAQRRKTLVNNLFNLLPQTKFSKEQIASILTELGFTPDLRGETLGIHEFCIITDRFYELLK